MVRDVATGAKINELNLTPRIALHYYILWFDITVYQIKGMNEVQSFQTLQRETYHVNTTNAVIL